MRKMSHKEVIASPALGRPLRSGAAADCCEARGSAHLASTIFRRGLLPPLRLALLRQGTTFARALVLAVERRGAADVAEELGCSAAELAELMREARSFFDGHASSPCQRG